MSAKLPAELERGIDEFNRHQFFQCHETLEALWLKQENPERELTQGIIQIAVAYYHWSRSNRPGAMKLMRRGLNRIRRFTPVWRTIDLESFESSLTDNLNSLESCDKLEFSPDLVPVISYLDHA